MGEPAGSVSPPVPLTAEQTDRVLALAADCARDGATVELVEFLDHGLPVDVRDCAGNTLLMLAAYHGSSAVVDLLIARGADVDARNDRDQSIVAGALFKGEDRIVAALVAAGADLDAGTPSARTAATMFGRCALLDEL